MKVAPEYHDLCLSKKLTPEGRMWLELVLVSIRDYQDINKKRYNKDKTYGQLGVGLHTFFFERRAYPYNLAWISEHISSDPLLFQATVRRILGNIKAGTHYDVRVDGSIIKQKNQLRAVT